MDPSAPTQQPATSDKTVSDILVQEGVIKQDQLDRLKVESAHSNIPIDEIILNKNLVNENVYYDARAKLIGVPFVSLSTLPFSPQAISFIPKNLAQKQNVIPFAYDGEKKTLSIAMADPLDLDAINFLQQKTGLSVRASQGIPQEIKTAIETQYTEGLAGEVKQAVKESEEISTIKTFDKESLGEVIKDAPIAKIVATTLEYAIKSRASDIHLEPHEDRMRVRYRIDGILYERLSLPKSVQSAVVSRIKILADMKIDEHRLPQDGRFNFKYSEQEVDVRVSVLPIVFGEKVVMRILPKTGGIPNLQQLGIRGTSLRTLESSILRPHGIIIVCGPTGSGKTTSLYSVLNKLNTTRVNILTLEDPVEYQMTGINQVQINPQIGLTFASGLRSFLRQDPNIILVGEIRDTETAELAIQAALTGHLVFSTLHTSSAAGAIPRLTEMGAETYLLSSTLNAVMGQRIARKICTHCRKDYVPPKELSQEIIKTLGNLAPKEPFKLYKGEGCKECGGTGYFGRVGIYEVMAISSEISQMILEKKSASIIEEKAKEQGMTTMKQDGFLKVLEGISTIDEILRVAQE